MATLVRGLFFTMLYRLLQEGRGEKMQVHT